MVDFDYDKKKKVFNKKQHSVYLNSVFLGVLW